MYAKYLPKNTWSDYPKGFTLNTVWFEKAYFCIKLKKYLIKMIVMNGSLFKKSLPLLVEALQSSPDRADDILRTTAHL
jgi:hypothetical protein